jgi:hypothetical protein
MINPKHIGALVSRHTAEVEAGCPTLLVNGTGSWAPDPEADGSARHFQDARVASIPGAVIGRIMIVLTCPCRKCARSWVRECSFVDLPAK